MGEIIKRDALGYRDHGWLQARHHFSFADYIDRNRMGLGALRVWNDDEIAAGAGFDLHSHQSMEIVTYVRSGAITHRDSENNVGRTQAGDIQVMSAGDGISHSEYNLESETTSLFQIWFVPRKKGGKPWWEKREFPKVQDADNKFRLITTGFEAQKGQDDAIWIEADAALKAGAFQKGQHLALHANKGMARYLVVDQGVIEYDGDALNSGDVVILSDEEGAELKFKEDSKLVMAEMLI